MTEPLPIYLFDHSQPGKKKTPSDLHQILYKIVCFIKVHFIKALLLVWRLISININIRNSTFVNDNLASIYLLLRIFFHY